MGDSIKTASQMSSRSERQKSRFLLQTTIYPGMPTLFIGHQRFPLNFAEGDVQRFNRQFISILEELRLEVQKRGVDLTGYKHDYLIRLRDIGKAAYNHVLLEDARRYFKKKEDEEQQRGLSLTFVTPPTFCFFWEMLYAGKPFGVQPELFWGFRYPIGHTYWAIEPRDRIRLQKGIFSAIHHKLLYSLQEVEQLTQQLQRVCQSLGSELSVKLLDQSISSESLCIDSLLQLFNDQNFCYGMIHFACHCWNPVDTAADRSSLSFTAHNEDLEIELEKLLAWEEDGFQNCPFVFLNACESATPGKLLETLRFPTAMLKFGAGGVIATACTVPDNFASAFASKFYEFLLTKLEKNLSVNIGEVLLETRLYFLHHFNNPLGLAYGLYALSNQELRLMD